MARTTTNTSTAQPGRAGGGGTTGGGTTGGGSGGGSTGISYVRAEDNSSETTSNLLGFNPGIPQVETGVILADGQYYGTFPDYAVAEQNQTYFAYFDGVGGMGPEIIDQTAYFIKYVIDINGNVVNPEPGYGNNTNQAVGLFNLTDNFEVGKRAIVKQIEYDPLVGNTKTGKALLGLHTITDIGYLENVAVTETGILPENYARTMSFNFTAIPYKVGNMDFFAKWYPGSNTNQNGRQEVAWDGANTRVRIFFGDPAGQDLRIPFTDTLSNSGNGWELITDSANVGKFKALSGSAETKTRIRFQASIAATVATTNYLCKISIYKNNNKIFESNNIAVPSLSETSSPGYRTFTSDWYQDYQVDDIFEVRMRISQYGTYIQLVTGGPLIFSTDEGYGASGNFIKIEQETSPNSDGSELPDVIVGVNTAYSPYFVNAYNVLSYYTSSNIVNPNASHTLLVLSPQLSSIFRSSVIQTINSASQSGIDGMNFNDCTIPFGGVLPGDRIRFEHNKNNVFIISNVGFWSDLATGSLFSPLLYGDEYVVWKISPSVGTKTEGSVMELNHFNIYRIINNGNYVILDVKKPSDGVFFSGILQPEFSSEELINNYNKIITTLTEKETIN